MVGELHRLLHQALTKGATTNNSTTIVILNGTGKNLRG